MRATALVVVFASGCATFSPGVGHDEVARLVAERTNSATGWEKGTPEETAIAARIDGLLAAGLTRPGAVAIALVNSPGLQATYEELGISQADLVQAGLLKNPTFSASLAFPLSAAGLTEIDFSLVQDVVDLITRSWRVDVSQQQFRASTYRVAQQALGLVREVNRAFVEYQAELEIEHLVRKTVEGAEGAHLLAEKQFAAGNITELTLANERATYARLQLELTQAEVAVASKREHLNRLLGLWGKRADWKPPGKLAELPATDSIPDQPERYAIRQRLDLAAARLEASVLAQVVALARATRLFGRVEVGADYQRHSEGVQLAGPTFSLELPLFDQRQAYIGGLEAQQAGAHRRTTAIAIEARSQVREGVLTLKASRAMATYYATTLVPLQDQIVQQAQLHYNGMLIGLYELIARQRDNLEARRDAIGARRDYWLARFELEHALGGSLDR